MFQKDAEFEFGSMHCATMSHYVCMRVFVCSMIVCEYLHIYVPVCKFYFIRKRNFSNVIVAGTGLPVSWTGEGGRKLLQIVDTTSKVSYCLIIFPGCR